MTRDTKRTAIGVVFAVFAILTAFSFYSALRPEATCTDGKRNQDESGIDCGGVCKACYDDTAAATAEDIVVREAAVVDGGPGRYDVLARIYNPNDRFGASSFSYTFSLKDDSGRVIAERSGEGFVLPKETKYIVESNLLADTIVGSVDFSIRKDGVVWEVFSGYRQAPEFSIASKSGEYVSSGVGFFKAFGILSNDSGFDFHAVSVNVVLRDASDRPIAVNRTELRTIAAGERRDVGPLVWYDPFPGDVAKVEMEAEADVYRTDNFIRQYVPSAAVPGF